MNGRMDSGVGGGMDWRIDGWEDGWIAWRMDGFQAAFSCSLLADEESLIAMHVPDDS
jgi:hypothetical protein